ncbi:Zn-finger, CCHC type, partial [Scheffersomyces stipitis CBS 6054]
GNKAKMSAMELSSTVDQLARVIISKNKQLEDLSSVYEKKLQTLNEYISKIQIALGNEVAGSSSIQSIVDDDFLAEIQKDISCPRCNSVLHDKSDDYEYIKIPKKTIRPTNMANTGKEFNPIKSPEVEKSISVGSVSSEVSSKNSSSHRHQQSKKICSYCKKPGHSRAKCYVRLSKPQS